MLRSVDTISGNVGLFTGSWSQQRIMRSLKIIGQPSEIKLRSGLPLSTVTCFIIAWGVEKDLYGVSLEHISQRTIYNIDVVITPKENTSALIE